MRCSKQRVGPAWALTVSEQSLVYPHQEIVITKKFSNGIYKLDRRQSKVLLTIDKRENKITRSSVFDCHLSPFGRKIAIENLVSNEFRRSTFVDSINVFDCRLSGVIRYFQSDLSFGWTYSKDSFLLGIIAHI